MRYWLTYLLRHLRRKLLAPCNRRKRLLYTAPDMGISRRKLYGRIGPTDTALKAQSRVNAMTRRIGVHTDHLLDNPQLHFYIVHDCACCKKRGLCRLWLADHDAAEDGYRKFCPNAGRFRELA